MKKILATPHNVMRDSKQGGFTLLELLLVIGVMAVLFLGISQITTGWVDSEVSTGAGQHLQRVSTVVQNYVEANWEDLRSAPTADALAAGGVWSGLKTALAQEGLLNNNELRTPLNALLLVGFVVDNSSGTNVYRATIYTDRQLPYKRVVEAARQAGNTGGMVSAFPDPNNAFGAFGQWKVDKNRLLPTGFALPCVPANANACLIAMISFNEQTLCGPFLYRSDVETSNLCPGGNTMTTNLQMSGNDITNAGTITGDTVNATNSATLGTTTVNGPAALNGPVTAAQGMNITGGGMTVSGDAKFSNDVSMNGGQLYVTDLHANTVQAKNIETNNMNAQNLDMNGNLAVDNDISINGNVAVNGTGQIYAGEINAGQVTTGGGDVTVGTMNIQNTMNINGQVNVTGTTIAADQLVANQCIQIKQADGTYQDYGTCP